MNQPDYSECWANCLGGCSGGMSKEHLVSECLFDGEIDVKGLPWCMEGHKRIPIRTLSSRILYRYHNSALSPLDTGVKQTFDTLNAVYDLMERRKKIKSKSWTVKYFTTDMLLLERWCLKTLINMNLSKKDGLPIEGSSSNRPLEGLVKVAFGMECFKPPMGLHMIAVPGGKITLTDGHVRVVTKGHNGVLAGAEFKLWGIPFFLNLVPETIEWDGGKLMRGEMKHWFRTYDQKNRLVKSHLLTFTYPKERGKWTVVHGAT